MYRREPSNGGWHSDQLISWDCETSLKYWCGLTTSSQWSIHFQSSGRCITETVYYNIDDSLKVYIRYLTLLIYCSTVWWPINYSLAHSDRALLFSFSYRNINANYRWPCIFIGRLHLHHKRHNMPSGKFWIGNLLLLCHHHHLLIEVVFYQL